MFIAKYTYNGTIVNCDTSICKTPTITESIPSSSLSDLTAIEYSLSTSEINETNPSATETNPSAIEKIIVSR
ncbi:MAG TPA: hypothetical protein PLO25_00375 [Candidatus Saccharibacteria bacterium]|nr:hypothetical protein [Candidatus Saccharibacteria bacterium]